MIYIYYVYIYTYCLLCCVYIYTYWIKLDYVEYKCWFVSKLLSISFHVYPNTKGLFSILSFLVSGKAPCADFSFQRIRATTAAPQSPSPNFAKSATSVFMACGARGPQKAICFSLICDTKKR